MNRSLRYSLYCLTARDPADIFDWEPLEGDPTKEERELAKIREDVKTEQEAKNFVDYYVSKGMKRENIMF